MQALFNFLAGVWRDLWPWVLIAPDQGGVRVHTLPRFIVWILQRCPTFWPWSIPGNGQWVREARPGACWKLPLFGEVRVCKTTPSYVDLSPNIRVKTIDNRTALISLTVKFHVHNVRRALLEVEDYGDSISIDVQTIVTAWANKQAMSDMTVERLVNECTPACRAAVLNWGCRLRELGVNSLADHRVYSLLQE